MDMADRIGATLVLGLLITQTTATCLPDFIPATVAEIFIHLGTPVVRLETLDLSDILLTTHILMGVAALKQEEITIITTLQPMEI